MSTVNNFLDRIMPKNETKEIQGGMLKARGKTLIFGNTIYQISNISVVDVVDMVKPLPWLALVIGLVGVLMIAYYDERIIGTTLLVIAVAWIYYWSSTRQRTGLLIVTNAGPVGSVLIVSKNREFTKRVALTLRNIMDSEDEHIVANFSMDTYKIEGASNSAVVVNSNVRGDLINGV